MDIVHHSVLKNEVVEYLKPNPGVRLFVDATLGEGGHSEIFLKKFPDLKLLCLEADPRIMEVAKNRLAPYAERIRFYNTWFDQFFKNNPPGDERPDGILFDLGISGFHYQRGGRGFSFRKDEPLDMRLGQNLDISARDVVNHFSEGDLADLLYRYGEERYSRRIAAAVIKARTKEPIETTGQLVEIIRQSVPASYRHGRVHPATRSFQALRIMVNGELARLKEALEDSLRLLKPQGRMGVISFHSLEDRMVKRFFRKKNQACICPSEQPICNCGGRRIVRLIGPRPIVPGKEEIGANPPSRSARFRVAEKLEDEEPRK